MTGRERLPNRRPAATVTLAWRTSHLAVSIGFGPDGRPREVFASGAREGSDLQATIDDACVVISLALQHGVEPDALGRSLGTVPAVRRGREVDEPASVIGVVTVTLAWRTSHLAVSIGFGPDGRPREVFASGAREGSDVQATIDDACVVISLALQHGVEPDALGRSLGTVPAVRRGREVDEPASVIGAVIEALKVEDARWRAAVTDG